MFTTANADAWLERPFRGIDLAALNAKAEMLERVDNKYVVSASALAAAVPRFAADFDILEIDGKRSFVYETCYFDDESRRSYFDHHQGRRRRVKIRVRRYVGAGLCYVEVKLKDKRGITVKKRMPYAYDRFESLDTRALAHIEESHRSFYGEAFGRSLDLTLRMRYRRFTLVVREGGERMTIDCDLQFGAAHQEARAHSVGEDTFIVETKSARGNGIADAVLREHHQHPTPRCSKYCVGMGVTGGVAKRNNFLRALRRLGVGAAAG